MSLTWKPDAQSKALAHGSRLVLWEPIHNLNMSKKEKELPIPSLELALSRLHSD